MKQGLPKNPPCPDDFSSQKNLELQVSLLMSSRSYWFSYDFPISMPTSSGFSHQKPRWNHFLPWIFPKKPWSSHGFSQVPIILSGFSHGFSQHFPGNEALALLGAHCSRSLWCLSSSQRATPAPVAWGSSCLNGGNRDFHEIKDGWLEKSG